MGPEQLASNDGEFSDLPLAIVKQIDELADEFESAWRSGKTPSPEEFIYKLESESATARAALLAHLQDLHTDLASRSGLSGHGEAHEVDTSASGSQASPTIPADLQPPLARLADDQTLAAGPVQVGEYQLLEQLGSGGMGVVYKARHMRLDRLVAIKFPRMVGTLDSRATSRFLREAKLIGRLDHPHIVRALDAGDSEYGPYLVTEFIDGETLEARVRREGPVSLESASSLIIQATQALTHAHSLDVVHRDIKPSNMLIDREGVLQVVDFGLAKLVSDDLLSLGVEGSHDRTESGAFLGTVGYAAPEQLRSDQSVDHRADIYALGCVLYFMLTGEPPYKGTLADRLLSRRRSQASALKFSREDLPEAFTKAWRRMVAENPQQRFETMVEVERTLSESLQPGAQPSKPSRRAVLCSLGALGGLAVFGVIRSSQSRALSKLGPVGSPPPLAVAPFDAEQAKAHQAAWAEHLQLPVRTVNSYGMPFVLIPPGEYWMGLPDVPAFVPDIEPDNWRYRDPEEDRQLQLPRHRVVLSRPIYFGETEITNRQFRAFVDATSHVTDAERTAGWGKEDRGWLKRAGYSWKNLGQRLCEDDFPVINVTWNDATAICQWLTESDEEGTYRLPTEAEWEYACRAGTDTLYYFGDDPAGIVEHGWCDINSDGVYREVGLKSPNPFGLYDMHGNRQEWCLDNFVADYYASSPVEDPICETGGIERVSRGGTHTDPASFCTSSQRWGQEANNPGAAGIRIVREIQYEPDSQLTASLR